MFFNRYYAIHLLCYNFYSKALIIIVGFVTEVKPVKPDYRSYYTFHPMITTAWYKNPQIYVEV